MRCRGAFCSANGGSAPFLAPPAAAAAAAGASSSPAASYSKVLSAPPVAAAAAMLLSWCGGGGVSAGPLPVASFSGTANSGAAVASQLSVSQEGGGGVGGGSIKERLAKLREKAKIDYTVSSRRRAADANALVQRAYAGREWLIEGGSADAERVSSDASTPTTSLPTVSGSLRRSSQVSAHGNSGEEEAEKAVVSSSAVASELPVLLSRTPGAGYADYMRQIGGSRRASATSQLSGDGGDERGGSPSPLYPPSRRTSASYLNARALFEGRRGSSNSGAAAEETGGLPPVGRTLARIPSFQPGGGAAVSSAVARMRQACEQRDATAAAQAATLKRGWSYTSSTPGLSRRTSRNSSQADSSDADCNAQKLTAAFAAATSSQLQALASAIDDLSAPDDAGNGGGNQLPASEPVISGGSRRGSQELLTQSDAQSSVGSRPSSRVGSRGGSHAGSPQGSRASSPRGSFDGTIYRLDAGAPCGSSRDSPYGSRESILDADNNRGSLYGSREFIPDADNMPSSPVAFSTLNEDASGSPGGSYRGSLGGSPRDSPYVSRESIPDGGDLLGSPPVTMTGSGGDGYGGGQPFNSAQLLTPTPFGAPPRAASSVLFDRPTADAAGGDAGGELSPVAYSSPVPSNSGSRRSSVASGDNQLGAVRGGEVRPSYTGLQWNDAPSDEELGGSPGASPRGSCENLAVLRAESPSSLVSARLVQAVSRTSLSDGE